MRRKKTDYTGRYFQPKVAIASLSANTPKHKESKASQYDTAMLATFSRYHTAAYYQYRFTCIGNALTIEISQIGNDIHNRFRSMVLGTIDNGIFFLADKIYMSARKQDASIFDVSDYLGMDTPNTLVQQCVDFASKYSTDDRECDRSQYRDLSGSNWKLKKRI
jgi:hypothetical protein